jgi:hypothetical protein
MRTGIALLVAAGLALAGCGGDDDDGDAGDSTSSGTSGGASEEFIAALTASLMREDDGESPLTTDEQEARCAAEGMTDAVDQERLEEAGMTVEALEDPGFGDDGLDLTEEEALLLADAVIDCVDVGASFASSVASDSEISAADSACLGEELGGTEELRGLLASGLREGDEFTPNEDQANVIVDAFLECVSFGGLIADSAADDGVELTAEQIACIDDGVRGSTEFREEFVQSIVADSELTDDEDGGPLLEILGGCVPLQDLLGGSTNA